MRMATFNVFWLGNAERVNRSDEGFDALARVVRSIDADVFCFQEVADLSVLRRVLDGAGGGDRRWEFVDGAGVPVASGGGGRLVQKVVLAWKPASVALVEWGRGRAVKRGRKPVVARFSDRKSQGTVVVIGVHLLSGWPEFRNADDAKVRGTECARLAAWIRGEAADTWGMAPAAPGEAAVILGDLNALRSSPDPDDVGVVASLQALRELKGWVWDDPAEDLIGGGRVTAWLPSQRHLIDHILLSEAAWGRCELPPTIYAFDPRIGPDVAALEVSDHRPVYADLGAEGTQHAKAIRSEVKILVGSEYLDTLRERLGLGDPKRRELWFFDTDDRWLLRQGLILRVRKGNKSVELTAKVRRTPLPSGLQSAFGERDGFKMERDASRGESVLAASLTEKMKVAEGAGGQGGDGGGPGEARLWLSPHQVALATAGAGDIPWTRLVAHGPIDSAEWEDDATGIGVESWTVADQSLVEVSQRTDGSVADALERLEQLLQSWGVDSAGLPGGKTAWALSRLDS
jgi:endonuclease/exonuclease/phosphatase family metal-dependent hydrolase